MEHCICGKSKSFVDCCGPFLAGTKQAKTPEQLMRSRYAAYALGGYGDYLIATWLPASAYGLTAAELSEKTMDWQRLDVVTSSQKGDHGVVEFNAYYRVSPESDDMECMHEMSEFSRINGRWLYVGARAD